MPPKKRSDPGPAPKRPKTIADFFGNKTNEDDVQFASTSNAGNRGEQINVYVEPGYEKQAKKTIKSLPAGAKIVVQGDVNLDDIPSDEDTDDGALNMAPKPQQSETPFDPPFCMPYEKPPEFKEGRPQPMTEAYEITSLLEEGLFADGLKKLMKTATNAVKVDQDGNKKIRTLHFPTAQQLQIACTILAHPDFTTSVRPWEENKVNDYKAALKALRTCVKTFSPADMKMEEVIKCRSEYVSKLGAYAAEKARKASLEKSGKGETGKTGMSDMFAGEEVCDSIYVQEECVFNQGGDIWELIAWMLSTSVKKKKRWAYWKKLLRIIMDTWDIDWYRCVNNYDGYDSKQAIFVTLLPTAGGTAGFSRCIRAAWARGEKEWRPWFENETKKYRKRTWQPWEVTPFEAEMQAMDPEEEISDEEIDLEDDGLLDPAAGLGGKEAVEFRCRLMALIASTSDYGFFGVGNTLGVFEEFRDHYGILHFPQFHYMVTAPEVPLDENFRYALYQLMIEDFLSDDSFFYKASDLKKGKKEGDPEYDEAEMILNPYLINQRKLEKCFVPFPANSCNVIDNAKMNILVEQLIGSLIMLEKFAYTPAFEDLVWDGIAARGEAISTGGSYTKKKKKKTENSDLKAVEIYNEISEWNLKILMKEERNKLWEKMNGEESESFSAEEKKALSEKMDAMKSSDASLEESLEAANQKLKDHKVYRQENQKEIQAKKEAEKAEKRQKINDIKAKKAVKAMKKEMDLNSEDERFLLSPQPKAKSRGRPKKKKAVEEKIFDDVPIINPKFKFTDEDLDRYDSDPDILDPTTGKVISTGGGFLKRTLVDNKKDAQGDTFMDDEEADVSKLGLKIANSDDEEGDSDDDLEFTLEQRRAIELRKKHNKNLNDIFNDESELSSLSDMESEEEEGTFDTAALLRQIKEGGPLLTK